MHALSVSSVSKNFYINENEDKIVLKDCSFVVEKGSIFGLVGLNGIGKTTLIKIILDMLTPDLGQISFFGINNRDFHSRSKICYLPERFQPSYYLTGYDFLKISLSFFKKNLNKNFACEIAEKIDLDSKFLDLQVSKYSKGMGQKLGLIACFMSGAELLILDEPMSGLDPKSRIMLKDVLKSYKEAGNSVFFSSHILEDVGELCDNMAVLHNTAIKFYGTPEELKTKYKNHNAEHAFLNCINYQNDSNNK